MFCFFENRGVCFSILRMAFGPIDLGGVEVHGLFNLHLFPQ